MFATLSLKELKQLVRALKDNHNIAGYSRMKKDDLVKALSARFVLLHGAIYLKFEDEDRAESQRIQDELDKAEAPAVEPKKAKPRAKKAAPKAPLTKEQTAFRRKIIAFMDKAETDSDLTPKQIRDQYQIKNKIELTADDKTFFNVVVREWNKANNLLA